MLRNDKVLLVRTVLAISISLALALTIGCSRDPNVRKQKYLESGKRYENSAKYKEAMIQFSNALKVDKGFGDAHYELAKTYLKMGNPVPAYAELMRTVALMPSNQQARVDLGNLLLAGRQVDRAKEQANAVLALNPNNPDAYALLGAIAQRSSDSPGAITDIQHALQLEPNRASFHTALALLQSGNPAQEGSSEDELRKAATLDPKNPTPHLVLAALLEKKGDKQGAEQQYLAAIAASPKTLQPRAALAGLYFRSGDSAKAEQTLHQAAEDLNDSEDASALLVDFYIRTNQIDHAVGVFADLTTKYPKSIPIKITYARLLEDKRDFAKATTVVNELTKSDGSNPQVQILNALLLLNTGKTDDALTLVQKSVRDTPTNPQTQILLARIALAKGNTALAETSFQAAAKLAPNNLEAATGLAEVALERNDASLLQEIADKTIQQHPDFPAAYLWRGSAEASRKEYDKAEADFQTLLKKVPNSAAGYLAMSQIRFAQGHVPEGKAMLDKSLELDPNSSKALAMLVEFDLRAKEPAKALARVQAQIAKSPQNASFYTDEAFIQLLTQDFKGALVSSKKAMDLDPKSNEGVTLYTKALTALGDVDSAIGAWNDWIKNHPNDSHAYGVLGSLEETKGDSAKAEEDYKKTLAIDPNDPVASNNLAYLMVESGQNVDVALSLAQTARRVLPNSPDTADTLAWIYFYKGNFRSARDLLEDALKTNPEDASIQYHLGMTYSRMNDKPNAVIHLKKAMAIAPTGKNAQAAAAELSKLG